MTAFPPAETRNLIRGCSPASFSVKPTSPLEESKSCPRVFPFCALTSKPASPEGIVNMHVRFPLCPIETTNQRPIVGNRKPTKLVPLCIIKLDAVGIAPPLAFLAAADRVRKRRSDEDAVDSVFIYNRQATNAKMCFRSRTPSGRQYCEDDGQEEY